MSNSRLLSGIIALMLISGCGVKIQGIEIDRVVSSFGQLGDLSEKDQAEEIQMGLDTRQSLLTQTRIANDETIQRYVTQVGYWLARNTSRPDLPWRFTVLDDSSVNAFAAPGGQIFITTGMIASLTSEAELAGVLAHEIGHVLKRHHLNAIQDQAQRGLLSNIAVLGAQTRQASKQDNDTATAELDASSAFERGIRRLYEKGLDRGDELEADQIGIRLAAKCGYDPYAFVSVLLAIQSREDEHHDNLMRFINTHPSAEQRLSQLEPTLFKLERYELEMQVLRDRFVANTRYQ